MQHIPHEPAHTSAHAAYAVYSFNYPVSDKKGSSWRKHVSCNNREEALWIAEQLERCDDVERIEIRLEDVNRNRPPRQKTIKVIDKRKSSIVEKLIGFFTK
ncbi:MAG: hypothetical protein AB7E85_03680 [Pseudobdellovibrionaceae bacterium]